MYGLNDEPTWRSAWVARLNFDSSKSRPPTIALTSPVELSSAISAPCTPDSCSSETRLCAAVQLDDLHVDEIAAREELLRRSVAAST